MVLVELNTNDIEKEFRKRKKYKSNVVSNKIIRKNIIQCNINKNDIISKLNTNFEKKSIKRKLKRKQNKIKLSKERIIGINRLIKHDQQGITNINEQIQNMRIQLFWEKCWNDDDYNSGNRRYLTKNSIYYISICGYCGVYMNECDCDIENNLYI
jgi:hypothetical protein